MQSVDKLCDERYNIAARQYYPCALNRDGQAAILATHKEVALLHRCADWLRADARRRVVIVITAKQTLIRFIINTLIHFGASCGQIQVDRNKMENPSEGVWLLMLQYQSAE